MLRHVPKTSRIGYESDPGAPNSPVAECPWYAPAGSVALSHRLGRSRGPRGERHRPATGNQSQDRDSVAHAFYRAGPGEPLADRSRSRTQADLSAAEDQSPGGRNPANQARGHDPLELPHDGESARREQIDGEQHLAQSPGEAASGEALQALARSALSGEAD